MAAIENTREKGGALALGGRRWYITHNNQMNDGVGSGRCFAEEMQTGGMPGRWRSLVSVAVELNNKKIRQRRDAPALDGCFLTVQRNNQIDNGFGGGECVREEMQMGGTYGGWRSLVGAAVELNDTKNRERVRPFPSMSTN
jgi:hypothetical protein